MAHVTAEAKLGPELRDTPLPLFFTSVDSKRS